MRAAALLMAVLMLTAGCLGMGDDGDEEETAPEDDSDAGDQASPSEGSSDDNSSDDHAHQPEPEPHWDNRTGEVTGTNLLVESEGEAVVEEIDVPDTGTEFAINLTAESGEIDGEIYPPGCEEEDDEPGEDCSESLDTYESDAETTQPDGGTATWETQDPDAGTWTVRLWKADAGSDAVPYKLSFFYIDVHEPGPGHHS